MLEPGTVVSLIELNLKKKDVGNLPQRTLYQVRNLIEAEIGKTTRLVSVDRYRIFEEDPIALLRNVETSVSRIKDFRAKL